MVGSLTKLPLNVIGIIVFGNHVTPLGILAIFIGRFLFDCVALVAGILYSYSRRKTVPVTHMVLPKYIPVSHTLDVVEEARLENAKIDKD